MLLVCTATVLLLCTASVLLFCTASVLLFCAASVLLGRATSPSWPGPPRCGVCCAVSRTHEKGYLRTGMSFQGPSSPISLTSAATAGAQVHVRDTL